MTRAQKFRNGSRDPDYTYIGDSCYKANTLHGQLTYKIWSLALVVL